MAKQLLKKVFSVTNQTINLKKYKIITIAGFKIKFRNYNKEILSALADLKKRKTLKDYMQIVSSLKTAEYIIKEMPKAQVTTDANEVLKTALESVTLDGLYLEFGVFSGRTINFISQNIPEKTIYGFDSFEGLPETWRTGFGKGHFNKQELPAVNANVKLVKGWFNETLSKFITEHNIPCAFIHIDCDLYSSTRTIFELLKNNITTGTVIVFDEYFNYPTWEEHEFKAFQEFVTENNMKYEYIIYNEVHEQVAVKIIN